MNKYQEALDTLCNQSLFPPQEQKAIIQQLIDYTRPLTINEIKVNGLYIVVLANGYGTPSIGKIKNIEYQLMADWLSFYGLDDGYRFDDFKIYRLPLYLEDKES